MEETKKTCLHDKHIELGAQMSPFAGFDMPIQYEGIVEEHNAVRNGCGIFDVSHMGEVFIDGPDADRFVNHIFTNDILSISAGQCLYGMMLRENGGCVDDLLVYKRGGNSYLLVINASNIDKDVAWINANAEGYDVAIDNRSAELGEIAVQGPEAEAVMNKVLGIDLSALGFYCFAEFTIYGDKKAIISRTGYTGEDGFEIYTDHAATRMLWDDLIKAGAKPCGLGCRDTLRFEVGLPLYGDELTDDVTPVEAALSMFCKLDKPEFIGKEVVARQKAEGAPRKSVGLEILDRAIARHGAEVLNPEGEVIGMVTTGYRGISVDKSIAVALIDARYAARDTQLQVRVRRKVFPAVVVPKRFFKKSYKK